MSQVRDAGALAAQGIAGMTRLVQDLHEAIADRSFGGAPSRVAHDAIAGAAYAAVRAGGSGAVRAVAAAVDALSDANERRLDRSPRGRMVLGVVNGYVGDRLAEDGSTLAIEMGVRHRGRPVPLRPEALAAAYGDVRPRVAVLLHGLGETEGAWRLGAAARDGSTYLRTLAELGFTPVEVRYNSGLRIGANGRTLATLLDELVAAWPTPIDELALIGHSMGGLVIRSACHVADADGRDWPARVRDIVYLGAPHLGAPLEDLAYQGSRVLGRLPETRWLSRTIEVRSAGIRDLREGRLDDLLDEIPLLEGPCHHAISGTVTQDPEHPVGRALGDLLVTSGSASGSGWRGRRLALSADDGRRLGGATHFALLNHPLVDELLRTWLEA
jgi:pimeloyl-ACP methyl ester carboxylesterase